MFKKGDIVRVKDSVAKWLIADTPDGYLWIVTDNCTGMFSITAISLASGVRGYFNDDELEKANVQEG